MGFCGPQRGDLPPNAPFSPQNELLLCLRMDAAQRAAPKPPFFTPKFAPSEPKGAFFPPIWGVSLREDPKTAFFLLKMKHFCPQNGVFCSAAETALLAPKRSSKMEDLGGKAGISSPKMGIFHHRSFVPSESAFGDRKGYFYPPKNHFGSHPTIPDPKWDLFGPKTGWFFFSPCAEMGPFCPKRSCGPKMEDCGPAAPSLFLKTSFLPPKWASLPPKCTFFISWSPK